MASEKELTEKLKQALVAIKKLKQERGIKQEEIAIVGMTCRFPGDIKNPEDYWQLLIKNENAITEIPKFRWDNDQYFDEDATASGKINTKYGGFISDVEMFDNSFFNISPVEAQYMDPQQRISLEVCCEALERAGIDIESLQGSNTGVFLGSAAYDYARKHLNSPNQSDIGIYSMTGGEMYAIPGRVSYALGLQGASVLASTACSSSLVSIHQACQSLILKETDLALAGGSNLLISPEPYIALSKMGALSPDGRCKAFDASANGYVRGEGVGVLVLKRLSDAQKSGDNILAVLKATAVNQDGKSNGFTAPNMQAQEKIIETALEKAKLSASDIDFLEAHGTGTPLGDPIELQAITNVIKKQGRRKKPLVVGTVKTNFGHTEGAAGVAGVMKQVLALQNEMIPANLHYKKPNSHYTWREGLLDVPIENIPWLEGDKPRVGAVNSFGVSGTNAHCLIASYPKASLPNRNKENEPENYVLPIAAKGYEALKAFALKYSNYLQNTDNQLYDICASAVYKKTHYGNRVAFVGKSKLELQAKLQAFAQEESDVFLGIDAQNFDPKIAFVFSGHGSHWVGMGKQLWGKSDVFRQAVEECEHAFSRFVGWKLTKELFAPDSEARFDEVEIIQPIICAVQIALSKLWESKGILPEGIIGHSMGEVAAAHISGRISLKEAAKIICKRSQLMNLGKGKGTMAVIELSKIEAQKEIEAYGGKVSVAVMNSPNSTVISGETASITQILESLEARDIFNKPIKIDIASHCALVDDIKDLLHADLAGNLDAQNGSIPFYSTVFAQSVEDRRLDADYWASNLRQPVRFAETVSQMLADGYNTFIEISAHPVLCHALTQCFEHEDIEAIAFPTLLREKDEMATFRSAWSKLYQVGYSINWEELYAEPYQFVLLPTYPWQHKPFWLETKSYIHSGNEYTENTDYQLNNADGVGEGLNFKDRDNKEEFLETLVRKELLKASGYTSDQVENQTSFGQLGVDSMMAVRICKVIKSTTDLAIPTSAFWKYPSIAKLSGFLYSQIDGGLTKSVDEEKSLSLKQSDWLIVPQVRPEAQMRLFCFHGAGESAIMYHSWAKYLPTEIELVNIQLPGRGTRLAEEPYQELDKLLDDLLPVISEKTDKEFVFFGHSMGGLLAFFLTRKLRKMNLPLPSHLFISATPSLQNYQAEMNLAQLSESELIDLFPNLSEIGSGDSDFYQYMMKALKSDLQMAESFHYETEEPFSFAITVFAASEDDIVPFKSLANWEQETTATFSVKMLIGNHHYLSHQAKKVCEEIGYLVSVLRD